MKEEMRLHTGNIILVTMTLLNTTLNIIPFFLSLLPSPLKPQDYKSPNKSSLTHLTSLASIWYKI